MRLVEQRTQRGNLILELALLGGSIGKIQPLAGEIADLDDDGAPGGAAVHLDITVALCAQHQVEGLAPLGQGIDGVIEVLGRRRIEPAREVQQRVRVARHPERRRQARHEKLGLTGLRHHHQRLRLGREQRLERALAHAVALGLDLSGGFGLACALSCAETGDRRADGEGDDAEIDAERRAECVDQTRPVRSRQRQRRGAANRAELSRSGRGTAPLATLMKVQPCPRWSAWSLAPTPPPMASPRFTLPQTERGPIDPASLKANQA